MCSPRWGTAEGSCLAVQPGAEPLADSENFGRGAGASEIGRVPRGTAMPRPAGGAFIFGRQ